jgi:hypothetical protein
MDCAQRSSPPRGRIPGAHLQVVQHAYPRRRRGRCPGRRPFFLQLQPVMMARSSQSCAQPRALAPMVSSRQWWLSASARRLRVSAIISMPPRLPAPHGCRGGNYRVPGTCSMRCKSSAIVSGRSADVLFAAQAWGFRGAWASRV